MEPDPNVRLAAKYVELSNVKARLNELRTHQRRYPVTDAMYRRASERIDELEKRKCVVNDAIMELLITAPV